LYKEFGFFERLTKIEAEFPGANIILHKTGKLPQVSAMLYFEFFRAYRGESAVTV
jgi:hypothetical protein